MNEEAILNELREQTYQLKRQNSILFELAAMMGCLGDPPGTVRDTNLFNHRKVMIDRLEALEKERGDNKYRMGFAGTKINNNNEKENKQ